MAIDEGKFTCKVGHQCHQVYLVKGKGEYCPEHFDEIEPDLE